MKLFQVILKRSWLIKTRRCLCIVIYKWPSQNENYFLDILSKVLSKQTCQFENILLIRDLNLTVNNKILGVFMNTFNLESLINEPTCFQSASPTCIDFILTNKKSLFIKLKCFRSWNLWSPWIHNSEAATRGALWKNVLLEISQNSQENTCARVSFLTKLQTSGLRLY